MYNIYRHIELHVFRDQDFGNFELSSKGLNIPQISKIGWMWQKWYEMTWLRINLSTKWYIHGIRQDTLSMWSSRFLENWTFTHIHVTVLNRQECDKNAMKWLGYRLIWVRNDTCIFMVYDMTHWVCEVQFFWKIWTFTHKHITAVNW